MRPGYVQLEGWRKAGKEQFVSRSPISSIDSASHRSSSDELIARFIAPHPHRAGVADFWLPKYGYSVWILADALNDLNGDKERVASEYELPEEAVEAVAYYYERHREAIDAKILVNALSFNATA
jgi:hypothetical protein